MTKICQHCGGECGCGNRYKSDAIRIAYLSGEAGVEEKKLIHAVFPTMRERTEVLLAEAERRRRENHE